MSVINTMLRDLDQRRTGAAGDLTLMSDVLVPARINVPPLRGSIVVIPVMLGSLILATLYFWPRMHGGYVPKPMVLDVGAVTTLPATENVAAAIVASSPPQTSLQQTPTATTAATNIAQGADAPGSVANLSAAPADLLSLATSLEHVDSLSPASVAMPTRSAVRPMRRAATENVSLPPSMPVQQVLPATAPPVAFVPPAAASATIRLEPSSQTASERNLSEVQHAADLQRRGALAEAETSLRSVLDNDKGMIAARLALFSLLSRQQRNDEARKLLKDGVELAPTQGQLVVPYARLLAARAEWGAALDALVPAADALAQDAEYRALYGAVLQRLGRYPQSSAEYRAALRLAPTAGAWWVGLGLSLEGEGRKVEARGAYLQARTNTLAPDLAQFVDSKLARLGTAD
ncbi:MAG: hypothetical protein JWL63_2852 [Rhodocyclales bacterium]|nr:hypothetical protein [Rhodocyclales bacterium]